MADNVLVVRCSSLDLLWNCPQAVLAPRDEDLLDPIHPVGELGTAAHAYAATLLLPYDKRPKIEELADRYSVDVDELRIRCILVEKVFERDLKVWLTGGEVEIYSEYEIDFPYGGFDRLRLCGTTDIRNVRKSTATGKFRSYSVDYKFGRVERATNQQRRGYAFLAWKDLDLLEAWSGAVYPMLEDGLIDAKIYQASELDTWFDELQRRIRNAVEPNDKYAPGTHCVYCPRRTNCKPRTEWWRETVSTFSKDPVPVLVNDDSVAEAFKLAKAIIIEADRMKDFAMQYADDHKGEILPSSRKSRFEIRTTHKDEIDPAKAWPIVLKLLGKRVSEAMVIRKGAMMNIVGENAIAAGEKKGAAIKEAIKLLEDAGAISKKPSRTLKEISLE